MHRPSHAGDRIAGLISGKLSLLAVLSALVLIPAAKAAPGDLDPSFGTNGKVVSQLEAGTPRAGVLQPDGRIIVAVGASFGFGAARYNANGTLDTSFSSDGQVATDFGPGSETAAAIVRQSDGKIVVAGSAAPGGFCCQFALARYNGDGSLDASFDGDGILTTPFGGLSEAADVVVQPDGKIVAAGGSYSPFVDVVALARYNADGSLDTTFDGDGKLTTDFGGVDTATSIVLQPDGKLIVAGAGGSNDFVVARYNSDGSLDSSFHGDGKVTTDFALPGAPLPSFDRAEDVVLQPDGRIIAAGAGRERFALARYEADGDLDPRFDGDGKVTTQFFGLNIESAHALALQPNGLLLVAGRVFTTLDSDFAIARYDVAGSLDPGFGGSDGVVTTDFPETIGGGSGCPSGQPNCSGDSAWDVLIQPNGKVIAIGGGGPGTPGGFSLLARYDGDILADSTPPVIDVPTGVLVDATDPSGAIVSFATSAEDDVDGPVPVTCAPPSDSTLPIGTTTVNCSATDAAGNAASASFTVHVKGAPEQVADLIALVDGYNLRLLGAALHDKLVKVQEFLAANKPKRACEKLDNFLAQVKEQRGKRLPIEQADRLTMDARRIRAVIGC